MTNDGSSYEFSSPMTFKGIEVLRKEIQNGNLEVVFKILSELLSKNSSDSYVKLNNELSLIRNDFYTTQVEKTALDYGVYDTTRNRISLSLLTLLDLIEVEPDLKKEIELLVSLAKTEEAISALLNASVNTKRYHDVLVVSSRFHLLLDEYHGRQNRPSESIFSTVLDFIRAILR